MSDYIPQEGDLFYVKCNFMRDHENRDGTLTRVRINDNSYSDAIFQMIAKDNTALIGARVFDYGSAKDGTDRKLFRIEQYEFSPVGPDVYKTLGIDTALSRTK